MRDPMSEMPRISTEVVPPPPPAPAGRVSAFSRFHERLMAEDYLYAKLEQSQYLD